MPPKAVQKLQPSRLRTQLEGLSANVDLGTLKLARRGEASIEIIDKVLDGEITRTIEGASTVVLMVSDADRKLLKSGHLSANTDTNIDGLWFRLVGVEKQGNDLTLTFEDREVALLRQYNKKLVRNRTKVTRAQFVKLMVEEVKEVSIRFECPELRKRQPIQKKKDKEDRWAKDEQRDYGLPIETDNDYQSPGVAGEAAKTRASNAITVKGEKADKYQLQNIESVLDVGVSMGANRKTLIASIMCITQESSARNLSKAQSDPTPGTTSVGIFQQQTHVGGRRTSWPASRDVEKDAAGFFKVCIEEDRKAPNIDEWELVQRVQRSANGKLYDQWLNEATHTVNMYGVQSNEDLAGNNNMQNWREDDNAYLYTRGKPDEDEPDGWDNEDSWTCMQRLASEVNWRAFCVSGTIYYTSEMQLFKSRIRMRFNERSDGISWIDFDLDVGRKDDLTGKQESQINIIARATRWTAPPGSVIWIAERWPIEGRWLVSEIRRKIFSTDCTIIAKKPRPKLPEPREDSIQDQGGYQGAPGAKKQGKLYMPLTTPMTSRSEFDVEDAEGAPSTDGKRYHAAKDWFAPPGSAVFAPLNSLVVEVKQQKTDKGQVFGGTVKVQELSGNRYTWVFRHVGPAPGLSEGDNVKAGTRIASVTRWADAPGSSHAHIEVWASLSGGYQKDNMVDPVLYIKELTR